jgi:hypothetical protein
MYELRQYFDFLVSHRDTKCMITSTGIQNWNLVSRGYRDTANLEPWSPFRFGFDELQNWSWRKVPFWAMLWLCAFFRVTLGLVIPLWSNVSTTLDGDGWALVLVSCYFFIIVNWSLMLIPLLLVALKSKQNIVTMFSNQFQFRLYGE